MAHPTQSLCTLRARRRRRPRNTRYRAPATAYPDRSLTGRTTPAFLAHKQSILLLRGEMDCFASLAMTARARLPRPDQWQRFVALEQIKQGAQRLAARALKLRIVLHDAQGFVARLRDQLAVHVGARDAIAGQAALPHAKHVAFATQFQ